MKTFKQILKETVEGDKFSEDNEEFNTKDYFSFEACEIAAKLYAQQVGEDVRESCLLNAYVRGNLVDSDSIMNTKVVLP